MVQQVVSTLGTVDILVNNAGYVAPMMRNFTKETEDYWNQVIAVCLNGVILCSRAVVDTMISKKGGKIVKYCLRCSKSWAAGTGCLLRCQRRRGSLLKGHSQRTCTLQHQCELYSSRRHEYTGFPASTGRKCEKLPRKYIHSGELPKLKISPMQLLSLLPTKPLS